MIHLIKILFAFLVAYCVGSIPTAYIFGRVMKGIDIREHGSGNVGATNTFRVLGKTPGTAVLIFDIFKGVVATTWVADILGLQSNVVYILLGLCAVAGHNWTIFLEFKGGKGIATSLGVLIGLAIKIVAIRPVLFWTILAWIVSFLVTAYISLASIIAATALPVIMVMTNQSMEIVILGIIFCVFVVFRHQSNIKRILAGEEPKIDLPFKKK